MTTTGFLPTITASPFLSAFIWIILILAAMYLARKPFHRCMASFSLIIRNSLRLFATSVKLAEKRLNDRNRDVLLSAGRQHAERCVEREFERISTAVQRDLEGYPQLQRRLNESLVKLDEDYRNSVEIPQTLPDWVKVIKAIAAIRPSNDPIIANMLEDIHQTISEQHTKALEQHRIDASKRHGILNRMMPLLQNIKKTLGGLNKSLSDLNFRAKRMDRYIDNYEQIREQTDTAMQTLSSSSLTQFFISGGVLLVALGGAIINFNLIALPMSEMVGGASYIGPYKTSNIAGLVIICLEICTGIFLMESLRITRLFPIIGSMDDRMRMMLFWIALSLLAILAGVESALAFMRDRIAADMEALRQSLAGVTPNSVAGSVIPTAGQMVMGFILPFILTFVAIPLESFVASARTILGLTAAWMLRSLAFILRLIGHLGYYVGRLTINLYDLVIFPALWLEGVMTRKLPRTQTKDNAVDKEKTIDSGSMPAADPLVENKEMAK
ncbi:MAG: hypothetical protein P8012_07235 [Desulfobacterales bacterium]